MALTQVLMLVGYPHCAVLDTWFRPFAYLPTATLVEATVNEDRLPEQPEELVQVRVPGSEALAPAGQAAVKVAAEKAKGDHYAKKARDHEDLVAELTQQGLWPVVVGS